MKINSPSIKAPLPLPAATRNNEGAGKAGASGSPASGSAVALSTTARHLARLENSEHDVNVAKVSEIRAALASGQLKINPERIADGLIASARELLK